MPQTRKEATCRQVMVTGAAGYIGSVVVQALLRSGYDILGIDNLTRGHRAAIDEGMTFYRVSAGDSTAIEQHLGTVTG